MTSLLDRELLVITGKGGVGKTTLAAAVGLLAAERGLRTIVVEVGAHSRLPDLFDRSPSQPGSECELQRDLWSISIDPDQALMEWLQALGGRVSGRLLASSSTFQYFAAAAPGASELVSMVKIWGLTRGPRRRGRSGGSSERDGKRGGYDLVVLDAPATGHALGMLASPHTFGAIARVGPIAGQAERLRALLEDPTRSGYLAVAHGSEMAVTETLELQEKLQAQLGRDLHAVILNGLLPQRFSAPELRELDSLLERASKPNGNKRGKAQGSAAGGRLGGSGTAEAALRSAVAAAHAVADRARFQHNQTARLRRRHFDVIGVPFQFIAELDLDAVRRIAEQLRRKL